VNDHEKGNIVTMEKKIIFIALAFISVDYVYSIDNIGWPDEISSQLIRNYTVNKQCLSFSEYQNEYVYILNFLDELIIIYKENIKNGSNTNTFMQKQPVIINGNLEFEEQNGGLFVWDSEKEIYREMADIHAIDDFVQLISVYLTQNQFIDYWHQKTGEILHSKYIIEKEIAEALTLFESGIQTGNTPDTENEYPEWDMQDSVAD
jgi:hypothetical protein